MSPKDENDSQPTAAFGKKDATYDRHALIQSEAANWLAEWLADGDDNLSCLEFGAGTGLLTQHLCDRFGRVEASDMEQGMLKQCRLRVPDVDVRQRNAWLPQPQSDHAAWDYIVSASLLQWAPDPLRILAQWRALLRPQGMMAHVFFVEPSLPEMIQVMDCPSPVQWRKPQEWETVIKAAGLDIRRIETKSIRCYYDDALQFWKSLHGTGAVVSRRLPPSRILKFFREYEKQFNSESGVYATWTVCRVLALKTEGAGS